MHQIESLFASNVIKETFSPLLENVLMNDSGGGVGGEANDIMFCRRKVYKCRDKYELGILKAAAAVTSSIDKAVKDLFVLHNALERTSIRMNTHRSDSCACR